LLFVYCECGCLIEVAAHLAFSFTTRMIVPCPASSDAATHRARPVPRYWGGSPRCCAVADMPAGCRVSRRMSCVASSRCVFRALPLAPDLVLAHCFLQVTGRPLRAAVWCTRATRPPTVSAAAAPSARASVPTATWATCARSALPCVRWPWRQGMRTNRRLVMLTGACGAGVLQGGPGLRAVPQLHGLDHRCVSVAATACAVSSDRGVRVPGVVITVVVIAVAVVAFIVYRIRQRNGYSAVDRVS
jgi:hypothetical protein